MLGYTSWDINSSSINSWDVTEEAIPATLSLVMAQVAATGRGFQVGMVTLSPGCPSDLLKPRVD